MAFYIWILYLFYIFLFLYLDFSGEESYICCSFPLVVDVDVVLKQISSYSEHDLNDDNILSHLFLL